MANFLSYSNLTYETVLEQINNKLKSDPRFDNFSESSVAQTLVEIFAGTVDLVNYYIERRAEESFMDTAKLKSSVILLAKQLGYAITRPNPATSSLKIKLSGDLTTKVTTGDVLQIPIYSNFNYNSYNFLLQNTYTYTFTSADINEITTSASDYTKELIIDDYSNNVNIFQGEIKTKVIEGSTNQQLNQNFQIYKIEDKEFSNKYGSEDYNIPITNVYVGQTKNDNTKYLVDRISLINWESIENFIKGNPKKVCVVRTSIDENIEILFGDAKYAEIGASFTGNYPTTVYDNIYIDYLATKGSEVNKSGVINDKVNSDFSLFVNGNDITQNVEFFFNSNIVGGSDIEDINSIKLSAPAIYYSLNRLVTSKDYVNYLKSLTNPINFKNAIAWGEQEEIFGYHDNVIEKMFNVVLFCALGSLYNLTGTSYSYKDTTTGLNDSLLDVDFDPEAVSYQSYFNLYVKENVVEQLKFYETSGEYYNLYGTTFTSAEAPIVDIKTNYDNTTLLFNYSSDTVLPELENGDPYLGLISTSAISLSAANDYNGVATAIQNALQGIIDARGNNTIGDVYYNSNYAQLAFPNIQCIYDSTNSRFIFSGYINDVCHIDQFFAANDQADTFASYIKISEIPSVKLSSTDTYKTLSSNLLTVIDNIKNRCQLTVRNVYVSPITQRFNLSGKIYVNKLSDKESIHNTIKNAIYSWLDINADFNVPLYISNIIEIIESYPNVVYSDVKLEPYLPTLPTGQTTFYVTGNDPLIDKYPEKLDIYTIIDAQLASYLYSDSSAFKYENELNSLYGYNIHQKYIAWVSNINEKTFFNTFAKALYYALPSSTETVTAFRDTKDFLDVLGKIHKDFSYIIKYNMLDSNGNVAPEYVISSVNDIENKTFYRGGYSVGSEILQLILNTTVEYK